MKNIIPSTFQSIKVSSKLHKYINKSNNYLSNNLEEENLIKNFSRFFDILIRFWKYKLSKIQTNIEFEEFLLWLQEILAKLEIEKIYNSTNIASLDEFNNLSLLNQFFYISMPIKYRKNFKISKWWVCYHWSLFFLNLFKELDINNRLDKKIVFLDKKFNHSVVIVWFEGKYYIVDPYAKWNWLLTEVKKGNKVYLWAVNNELMYGEIETVLPLVIKFWNYKLNSENYVNSKRFIESMRKQADLINIKIFLNWKTYHLIVKNWEEKIFINFNWEQFFREKDFAITEIVWKFLEQYNPENIDLLLAILGFEKTSIWGKNLKALEIIADKINWDQVFTQLGIKEDIEMFKF